MINNAPEETVTVRTTTLTRCVSQEQRATESLSRCLVGWYIIYRQIQLDATSYADNKRSATERENFSQIMKTVIESDVDSEGHLRSQPPTLRLRIVLKSTMEVQGHLRSSLLVLKTNCSCNN